MYAELLLPLNRKLTSLLECIRSTHTEWSRKEFRLGTSMIAHRLGKSKCPLSSSELHRNVASAIPMKAA